MPFPKGEDRPSPRPVRGSRLAGEDPRINVAALDELPALLREGAAHYAAREFWHAHEAWERAWHAMRAAGQVDRAAFVRGMILVTAAFENATRGKGEGFKRQLAEGLHSLLAHKSAGAELEILAPADWVDALVKLHVDASRRRVFAHWNESGWQAPPLTFSRDSS